MAASSYNRIEISPLPVDPIYREKAANAAITPGFLVAVDTADKVGPAGTGVTQPLFALENVADAGGIDQAYALNATTRFRAFQGGEQVNAFLADGVSVTPESFLVSNGDGSLKLATTETGKEIVARSTQTLNNTSGAAARLIVEIV